MKNDKIKCFAETIEQHFLSLVLPVIKRASLQLAQEINDNLKEIKEELNEHKPR